MSVAVLQAKTWHDLVSEIAPDTKASFPVKHKSTIRFYISDKLLKDFPDRTYKTWVDTETNTITVYRIR